MVMHMKQGSCLKRTVESTQVRSKVLSTPYSVLYFVLLRDVVESYLSVWGVIFDFAFLILFSILDSQFPF